MAARRSAHRRLTCRAARRLMQAYLDREIAGDQVVLVADHLDRCRRCAREATGYRRLKARMLRLRPPLAPGDLDRLRAFADDLI